MIGEIHCVVDPFDHNVVPATDAHRFTVCPGHFPAGPRIDKLSEEPMERVCDPTDTHPFASVTLTV